MNEPTPAAEGAAPALLQPQTVISALRQVVDPELQYNIVDIGLVYEAIIESPTQVKVIMTLTSPGCPYGPVIIHEVKEAVKGLGVTDVSIDITWDPPWSPDRMSDEAKLDLGFDL
jgi:metal-sulfur cluster biosynthetic enzyme